MFNWNAGRRIIGTISTGLGIFITALFLGMLIANHDLWEKPFTSILLQTLIWGALVIATSFTAIITSAFSGMKMNVITAVLYFLCAIVTLFSDTFIVAEQKYGFIPFLLLFSAGLVFLLGGIQHNQKREEPTEEQSLFLNNRRRS